MLKKIIKLLFKDFYLFTAAYSNNVFPDQLPEDKELEYIRLAKQGDKEATWIPKSAMPKKLLASMHEFENSYQMAEEIVAAENRNDDDEDASVFKYFI